MLTTQIMVTKLVSVKNFFPVCVHIHHMYICQMLLFILLGFLFLISFNVYLFKYKNSGKFLLFYKNLWKTQGYLSFLLFFLIISIVFLPVIFSGNLIFYYCNKSIKLVYTILLTYLLFCACTFSHISLFCLPAVLFVEGRNIAGMYRLKSFVNIVMKLLLFGLFLSIG